MESFGVKGVRIPPSSPTWNSDVEAFHGLIEDEFYEIEEYRGREEFMGKAWAYQLWFNYKRKVPLEIFEEVPHGEISLGVFNLPPLIVDQASVYLARKERIYPGWLPCGGISQIVVEKLLTFPGLAISF